MCCHDYQVNGSLRGRDTDTRARIVHAHIHADVHIGIRVQQPAGDGFEIAASLAQPAFYLLVEIGQDASGVSRRMFQVVGRH